MKKIVLFLLLCISAIEIIGADEQEIEAGTYSTHWKGVYESKSEASDSMYLKNDGGNKIDLYVKPDYIDIGMRNITNSQQRIDITGLSPGERSDRVKLKDITLAGGIKVTPYARVFYEMGPEDERYHTFPYYVGADVWVVVKGLEALNNLSKEDLEKLENYYIGTGSVTSDNVMFNSNSVENNGTRQNFYIKSYRTGLDSSTTDYVDDLNIIVKCSVTIEYIPEIEINVDNDLHLGAGLPGETLDRSGTGKNGYSEAVIKVTGAAYTLVHTTHPETVTIYKDGDDTSSDRMDVTLQFDENEEGIIHFGDEGELFLNKHVRLIDVNGDGNTNYDYHTADTEYYIDGVCVIPDNQTPGNYSGVFTVKVKYEE